MEESMSSDSFCLGFVFLCVCILSTCTYMRMWCVCERGDERMFACEISPGGGGMARGENGATAERKKGRASFPKGMDNSHVSVGCCHRWSQTTHRSWVT